MWFKFKSAWFLNTHMTRINVEIKTTSLKPWDSYPRRVIRRNTTSLYKHQTDETPFFSHSTTWKQKQEFSMNLKYPFEQNQEKGGNNIFWINKHKTFSKSETETSPVPISAASNTQQLNEFKVYETENQKKNKGHSMACPIEQFRTNVLPFVAFDQERKTSSLLFLPAFASC